MPTEGGRYALYRSLDSRGLLLQQSAQWVDAFTGNPAATVTLSVEWRSRDGMFDLPLGMANFYLRGSQPNDHPLQLRFLRADGSIAKAVDAGPGYSQPNHATAYLRVGELLSAIGEDADIRLEVRQGEADRAVTTLTVNWSTIPLRAAIAAYPVGRGWLDRAQAKPGVFCTPT